MTPYVLKPIFQDLLGFDVGVFNAASAGIVVGIMIIPMISSLSEDVLRSVPRSLREAAYALGSTRFDVSTRVVVPAALSGIIASFLLAISRAIGETMAVTIAAGQTAIVTSDPLSSVATMTSYIVNVSKGDAVIGSIEEKSIYAVGLTLFLMTLVMNIISQFVLRRFREVYNLAISKLNTPQFSSGDIRSLPASNGFAASPPVPPCCFWRFCWQESSGRPGAGWTLIF